ncbi:MAG: hypothetical protein ACXWZM_00245 [Solirubrobacterales bacterium]
MNDLVGRTTPRAARSLLALAAGLALLVPSLALATSKVSRHGNTIRITSGGKPSNLNIGTGIGSATIQDYRGRIGIGANCQRLDRHRAFCGHLNGRKVIAKLGGGKDEIGTLLFSVKFVAFGGSGNDGLFGSSRNDKIYGGSGGDEIYGGSGRDYLVGGPGRDDIDCDTGIDIAVVGAGDRTEECEIIR